MPLHETNNETGESIERRRIPPERIGGPLRPNHLMTTDVRGAEPLLEQLHVDYKVSIMTEEMPLGTHRAFAPAEYRIEIMDPAHRSEPAPEQYVRFVYSALKDARVPVTRGAPEPQSQSIE